MADLPEQVPADWARRATFLRFEGVTSGYHVWVNGQYIGYDQGGYSPAECRCTGGPPACTSPQWRTSTRGRTRSN
jgi:beta-galactosidase/beta-glucuronidase